MKKNKSFTYGDYINFGRNVNSLEFLQKNRKMIIQSQIKGKSRQLRPVINNTKTDSKKKVNKKSSNDFGELQKSCNPSHKTISLNSSLLDLTHKKGLKCENLDRFTSIRLMNSKISLNETSNFKSKIQKLKEYNSLYL